MFLKDLSKINADMVDGKHASNTANNVPVLDSNAKLPIAQVPTGTTSSTVALGNHNHDSVYTKPTGTITANRVAVFNDTTGRVIKDSGYTIATSVPSGAKFTDTVYTHPNDANTRHVTDTEKSTWNAKETTSGAQAKADAALASAKSYTDSKVAELVDSSPEALDTLNELAAALGDDPNFATTVSTQIGNKADTTYVDAELAKKSDKTHTHNYAGSSSVGGSANSAVKLATARTISATGDATGSVSFDGSKDVSVGLTLANSGATAGSYGPSANATASFGGTISVPQVTVDAKGRVTAASTKTITMPANPNSDTKVTNTLNTKAKAYVTGTTSATTNTGTQVFDTGVYLDETAGKLVATTFQGDLVGNASTATSATSATKATQDSAGQQINSTYIKNLSVNGKTITFTKGDGTTGTITTQDTDTNTWRGVQDNLTSTATDQSLSANQGKVLKGLIDGKADSSHTHNYAGSSSAGGAATSANKVNTNLVVKLNGGSTEGTNLFTFNGSAAKTVNITPSSIGAAASSHTHSYLPLSGGTVTSSEFGPLKIDRSGSTNGASIAFSNSNGTLGYIGMNGAVNGGLVRYSADTNSSYTVLDTGNYKNTVTPANIGAATSGHTHNYAGSSSAGGAANSAVKATQDSAGQQINTTYIKGLSVSGKTITYTKGDGTTGTITTQDTNTTYSTGTASALGLTKLYTGTGTATDGTMTQAALKTALDGKSGTGHTHNYAGSSSAGGAATTALACTGNAATATALQTGRTINGTSFNGSANITTANWGTARTLTVGNTGKSVNGSGNVSWSLNEIGAMQGSTASATTAATAGWYRIAQTTSTDQANVTGTFTITAACSGNHSSTILMSGISYGVNPTIQQLSHTQYSATGISQARIVYHTTYSGNRAYLEVYVPTAAARTITVQLSANSGWTLVAPSTAGSIPSGYTNKAITLASDRIVSNVTGALSGNASTATKATQDSAGQQINTTYIKGLSVSGRTITYTKGDGTTGTITTQDTDTNTTYSAGTGLSLSGTTFNHKNSVTAATAQGDASKTLSWGGTFTIPTITYDAQGHITGKGTTTMTMPANPNSDTKVTNTLGTTTKAYVTGTTSASTNTGTQIFDTGVYLDTTAGMLTATTFKGALSGNATTATTLQTARTINGTSFNGSANITTANWGTARNIYIADNSATNTGPAVSVNGSGNATLKLPATIKAALTGNATTATTLATARTINGTSFNGSANITTANWGTARTLSLTGDVTGSMSVNGSANVSMTATINNASYYTVDCEPVVYDWTNITVGTGTIKAHVVKTRLNSTTYHYKVSFLGMDFFGNVGIFVDTIYPSGYTIIPLTANATTMQTNVLENYGNVTIPAIHWMTYNSTTELFTLPSLNSRPYVMPWHLKDDTGGIYLQATYEFIAKK